MFIADVLDSSRAPIGAACAIVLSMSQYSSNEANLLAPVELKSILPALRPYRLEAQDIALSRR